MKNLMTLITVTIISSFIFGQSPLKLVKESVGNPDILKNWELDETKFVNNASIQRIAGENDFDHRTNLFYTSNKAIMKLVEDKAAKEMLSEELKQAMKDCYLKDAPGGQLSLFFDRNDQRLADPRFFAISVKNEEGNVVFQQALAFERPYYYKWGIWYYFTTINIPVNVGDRFSVEVMDAGLKINFTFLVTISEDADGNQQLLSVN